MDHDLHKTRGTPMKITLLFGLALIIVRVWIGFSVPLESITFVDLYKDVAHLFMGGLAVAWWLQRNRWQWWLFWALNAVEVVVAVWSRIG